MKNIAILVSSLKSGGAERIAGLLSIYLSKEYNVYIFIGDTDNIVYDYAGTLIDYSLDGAEKVYTTISDLKNKYSIDCAISFDFAMNIVNIITKEDECVIISHRCAVGDIKPYPFRIAEKIKRWYGCADKIISLSYGASYDLVSNFGINKENIITIYNFIDKNTIIKKAEEILSDDIYAFVGNSKLILNVGRLTKQKNQKKLLVQFSKICNDYDIKLIILGTGDMEDELKECTNALGIVSKVMFVPYCTNPFPYYKLADIFVLSSDFEGFGNVIIEAMLNKTPCVCVDCFAGPREIIKGSADYGASIYNFEICERGVLVQKADTDTTGQTSYLANAIKVYLDDKALENEIIQNCNLYMEQYNNNKISAQWINIIENTSTVKMVKKVPWYPQLDVFNKVIVYGAGFLGKITMKQIESMENNFEMLCFAVSDKNSFTEDEIMGHHVYELSELVEYKEDAIVFIGITDINGDEEKAIENLIKYGFKFTFPDLLINYY